MPQNTPMKRQFTTIDGRTVMSNLPQHWGGNDWAITGVDNPLPVGNYVQTESGVWIPQKGSDDGAADVRLTGSIVKYRIVNQVEIRDEKLYEFEITIPDGVKDFELFFSDSHNYGSGMNASFPLCFAIGQDNYNRANFTAMADDGIAYGWVERVHTPYNGMRRFSTKIKGGYGRDGYTRRELTLTDMFLHADIVFFNNTRAIDGVAFKDRLATLNSLKKSIMYSNRSVNLLVRFEDMSDKEDITGSLSVDFVGWKW